MFSNVFSNVVSNRVSKIKMSGLLLAIVFTVFQAQTSMAAELAPDSLSRQVSLKGSARLRYEDTQWYGSTANPNSFSRTAFFSFRVRPTVSLKVDEALSIVLTPQFAKVLGRDYSYTQTDSSGAIGYNEHFHMHEAYGKMQLSPGATLKAGRMIISHGDQLIIAAGEWPLTGRSFDGFNLAVTDDLVDVDVFSLKIESTANTIGTDRDLTGLYSKWKTHPNLKALDFYALYESNMVGGVNESRNLFGGRVGVLADPIDIGLEAASHAGTGTLGANDSRHSMAVATIGYNMSEFSKLRIGYEFNQADENWRDWYALLKGPLGRNEIVGRRNLTAHALRISFEPVETYKVRLDLWKYDRSSTSAPVYRPVDSVAVGTIAGSSSKEIGQAVDFSITQKVSDKIEYGFGATLFEQGAYLKDQFGDRQMTDLYLVANINF